MKKRLFQVDLNPWHYFCNMSCSYCIKHVPFWRRGNSIFIKKDQSYKEITTVTKMMTRVEKSLEALFSEYEVSIITFSGSETFLFPEINNVIEYASQNVSRVQLITNGTLLTQELLLALEKLKEKIHISLSLDGCTPDSNYARTQNNYATFERVLTSLKSLVSSELSFDVMTVLSKYNIFSINDFLNYLQAFAPSAGVQMWPVFGSNTIGLVPNDHIMIDAIVEQYSSYNLRLQPKEYFVEMSKYLRNGRRIFACELSKYCIYLNDLGEMKECPCNGLVSIRNLFSEKKSEFYVNRYWGQEAINLVPCSSCFINWDVINLYLHNRLSIHDIGNMPLFSNKEVIQSLVALKAEYKEDCKDERDKIFAI